MTASEITAAASNSSDEVNYWQSELSSLAIECKRKNELNHKDELQALTIAIKELYFQDYMTAYNSNTCNTEVDQSHFDNLI